MEIVRTHLEYGADPNVSLESCPLSWTETVFFYPVEHSVSEGATLLHVAAISLGTVYDIYPMIKDAGGDEDTVDALDRSAKEVKEQTTSRAASFRMRF